MQANTQKWRPYIPLSELTISELQRLNEAIERVLDQNHPSEERIDWFGAFGLGRAVRDELSSREEATSIYIERCRTQRF